ncbi:MAG TPA: hypothetical protein VFK38_08345 [Candidatus Limnocylindrales bacterium]|nr:hypothetical protein [Candidatus Limnocylindrales bacterium]
MRPLGLATALALCAAVAWLVVPPGDGTGARAWADLVLRADDGREVLRKGLPRDGRFSLTYRNSVYGASVSEEFRASTDARLTLMAVWSDRLAVLEEYYGLPTAAVDGTGWRSAVEPGRVFEELRLVPDRLGERALRVEGSETPLAGLVAEGDVLVLRLDPSGVR